MSATNLDLPVLISAAQIRRREFVTIRRGYDPDQVRKYLQQIADQVDQMQTLLREARAETSAATRASEAPRADPYEQLASRVSDLIRQADEAAEQIRTSAREEAERMTREARAEADRMRTDAQARAEETRSAAEEASRLARVEVESGLTQLIARRDAIVEQLASMQERSLAVARDLARAIALEPDEPVGEEGGSAVAEGGSAGSSRSDAEASTPSGAMASEPTDAEASAPSEAEVTAGTDRSTSSEGDAAEASDAGPGSADETDGGTVAGDEAAESAGSGSKASTSDVWAMGAAGRLDDPAYEELLEATEAMQLDMPDIPLLDLDWGDDPEDDAQD